MTRFLAKTKAHTSCPLHQSRVPKHLTRICVSSNNMEPSVLHIAAVCSNNNFILSCAPHRICASLSFSIFILLRRLLSPSQVARELHGGPFVWRSNFSLSLYIRVRGGFSLSFSIFMCTSQAAGIGGPIGIGGRPHPPLPRRRAPRRAGPQGMASPKPDSAALDDLHLSTTVARGPSRHCFPLQHAPELPSVMVGRRTVHLSFPLQWRRPPSVRSGDGSKVQGLDLGPMDRS
jgi:hypothetical protein